MTAPTAERTWEGTGVDMTDVSGHLADLWSQVSNKNGVGAVRTHTSNLVVYAGEPDEAKDLEELLRQLAERHPSRTVMVISDRQHPTPSVDARADVYCQQVPSLNAPLCHEQVIVTAHGRAADHPASIVSPLLLPELPTSLWWPGQPLFGHRVFHRLLELASELIVDSGQFNSPGDGFASISRILRSGMRVKDLNWVRLSPWRDIVAGFFDGQVWAPYAYGIRSIRVTFGSGKDASAYITAGTLLLLGWIGCRLEWQPDTTLERPIRGSIAMSVLQGERLIPIDLGFEDRGSEVRGRLTGIEVISQPKGLPPARFRVERTDDARHARATSTIHDGAESSRVVQIEMLSEGDLLAMQLDVTDTQDLYDEAAALAARLAGRELWLGM
ncbi:MAG TPA: glucose-6-phosphate dehydrogenase assembly protein OpcA [Chloroflexota bacterium]|nr:glucose-6-phosphate dehydrogenase assembly protein OpcA [Chloroflexota bacterium]